MGNEPDFDEKQFEFIDVPLFHKGISTRTWILPQ